MLSQYMSAKVTSIFEFESDRAQSIPSDPYLRRAREDTETSTQIQGGRWCLIAMKLHVA